MKGIFITYVPTEKDTTGVGKKIRGQIQAFNKNDLYCSEITMYHSTSKLMRLLYKFPFTMALRFGSGIHVLSRSIIYICGVH